MVGYLEGRQHSEIGPFEGETSMAVCKNGKIYMKDRHVQKQLVSRYHLLTCCMFFYFCQLHFEKIKCLLLCFCDVCSETRFLWCDAPIYMIFQKTVLSICDFLIQYAIICFCIFCIIWIF